MGSSRSLPIRQSNPRCVRLYQDPASRLVNHQLQTIRKAYQPGLSSIPGPFITRYTNLVLKWNVTRTEDKVHPCPPPKIWYVCTQSQAFSTIIGPMVRISPNEVGVADLAASRRKPTSPRGLVHEGCALLGGLCCRYVLHARSKASRSPPKPLLARILQVRNPEVEESIKARVRTSCCQDPTRCIGWLS